MRVYLLLVFASALGLGIAGCETVKDSSTPRTAMEQALLSEAAVRTIAQFKIPDQKGKTFWPDASSFKSVDGEFILGALVNLLLDSGMSQAKTAAEANIIVSPRVAYAGTDGSTYLIGIPAFPIPVPFTTGGVIQTPEIALYKLEKRFGRNRMALHAIERETGKLAFEIPLQASQSVYKLWTFLIFIHFRTTDMPPPY